MNATLILQLLSEGKTITVGARTFLGPVLHGSAADLSVASATVRALVARGLVTVRDNGEFKYIERVS